MKFSIYQSSRQGGRKYNQDRVAYSYSKDSLMMAVADGMGGHLHGELAAQITVQLLASSFQRQSTPTLHDPFSFLANTMQHAHEAIGDYAIEHNLLETPRTTCVACVSAIRGCTCFAAPSCWRARATTRGCNNCLSRGRLPKSR
jgi:serine/threonine protein phosphatase PrpC